MVESGALGPDLHLVSERCVGDEHGQKFDRCDELVIMPDFRVKPAALVVGHALVVPGESSEGNGQIARNPELDGGLVCGVWPVTGTAVPGGRVLPGAASVFSL